MSCKITIELEIDGNPDEALYVVSELLDAGQLQDAINDHDFDVGKVQVVSALARQDGDSEDGDGPICPHASDNPCSSSCPGWGFFNGEEMKPGDNPMDFVQKCDECEHYDCDEDAQEHLAECEDCQAYLAACVGQCGLAANDQARTR
jgi:hypothetical protein